MVVLVKLTKTQRQHRVSQILEKEGVTSQAELVKMLADEGVEATQVTVSRDLEELGAVKVRRPGGALVYALPATQTNGRNQSSTCAGSWESGSPTWPVPGTLLSYERRRAAPTWWRRLLTVPGWRK